MLQTHLPTLVWFLVVALTVTAAVTDARRGVIPNWLTLPCALGAPLAHLAVGGPSAALVSVLGLGLCALVPWLLFLRSAIGGGDVKLFAAIGALAGPRIGISLEIAGFVATAVYAMGVLSWRGRLLPVLLRSGRLLVDPFLPEARRSRRAPELMEPVRMGIPVLGGVLGWLFMVALGGVG